MAENLGDLVALVRQSGADVGMATDPDVDRLALVDETGTPIGEDYTLAFAVHRDASGSRWHYVSLPVRLGLNREADVKAVEFEEGTDFGCDFCSGPSVAVYEIDAQAQLGDAAYNTAYCQSCAVDAANSRQVDYWAKDECEAREAKAHLYNI